jgi:hypothetical protein
MKYIGSSTTSKNTKNRIRSWATKVPIMPVSRIRIRDRNALGLCGLGDVVPGVDHHQRHDEQCQPQQRQRDAVDAHDEPAPDPGDPGLVDHELQVLGGVVVEAGEHCNA